MDSQDKQTFFTPVGEVGGSVAYGGVPITSNGKQAAKAADKYLKDSLLLNKLTDRVYELLLTDLRCQQERFSNYTHQRWL